ncbi:MAG: acyl-CoA dehydrogenase family protein [Thermodesulfobacteriota bacterium]|nr:acyl-CoA dehydrogenase family protein [Thermodesulfobacteriota bacterium]
MDFEFSEDQKIIANSVRDFLQNECPKEKIRDLKEDAKGYDPEMWRKMVEMGWMGIVFPEQYGGTEGEFLDLMVLVEEMGRNILPAPFFSTIVLCALPILEYGTHEQKEKILPKIANGEEIWTLALTESHGTYEPSDIELLATLKEGYVLEGTKLFVPYAHVSDYFLVVSRTNTKANPEEGITVFMVDAKSPGIKIEVIPTIAHDKQCEIIFDKVRVPKDNVLGTIDKGWDIVEYILQRASVLKSAEMLGGAQTVLNMANDYAKERVQFDRAIGSFQAIQHKLADLLIDIEGLRYLVYEAALQISIGSPSNLLASMAKARANEVYQRTCIEGVKVHGAIGFTEELDLSLYHVRTKASEFALGDSSFHKERIARELERQKPIFLQE